MQAATKVSERAPSLPAPANWLGALRAYLLAVAAIDLLWETAHLPLYTLWHTGTPGETMFAVIHSTTGDLLIALAALTLALVLVGSRDWPVRRFAVAAALTLAFGFGYTVFSEWLNTIVRKSWAYSDLMPVVTVFGLKLGVSPLLQWVVVPILALYAGHRAGTTTAPGPEPSRHDDRPTEFVASRKERT